MRKWIPIAVVLVVCAGAAVFFLSTRPLSGTFVRAYLGSGQAQYELATHYGDPASPREDPEKAFYWLARAADNDVMAAQIALAHRFDPDITEPTGVLKDSAVAKYWYKRAADLGDGESAYALAWWMERGDDAEAQVALIVKYLTQAAQQNVAAAQNNLGLLFQAGHGVPEDQKRANALFAKAAAQGNDQGQYNLATAYDLGFGMPKDKEKAIFWYKKAVENDNLRAIYVLGLKYLFADGTKQDYAEAARLFTRAAKRGHAEAQLHLAVLYVKGWGVPHDQAQAVHWFQQAAVRGNGQARYLLGQCYEKGLGLPEDKIEAMKWYLLARKAGHPIPPESRHFIASLSEDQRTQAQQAADQWKHDHS